MLGFTISMSTLPNAIKCSYRSKPCDNVRATKLNGDTHKLCEYHRRRANLNQQRVHQRRKMRQLDEQRSQCQYRSSVGEEERHLNLSDLEPELECEPSPSPCGDLPLPDLELLEMLLTDNLGDAKNQREFCQISPMGV